MLKKNAIIYCLLLLSLYLKAQPGNIGHYGVEEGLPNNYVIDITQDGQGFIWIATESGLSRFDGRDLTVYTKNNSGIVSNALNTLLYDHDNNQLWIGSQRDGISIFDLTHHTFSNLTTIEGLATNDVTHISHAEDGGIWITHYHVGVEYFDLSTRQLTPFLDHDIEGMKSQNWCSFDDENGNLFVGHAFDGLSIIDIKNKTAHNIRHQPGNPKSLPGNTVRTIYRDSKSNIWVGTNNGLALFNPETEEFTSFQHNPSDPNSIGANYIHSIREMHDGNLWISTDMAGVSILNLNSITFTDPKNVKFNNISIPDNQYGLSSSNIRVLFQDTYSNIWIGHYNRGVDFITSKPSVFQTLLNSTYSIKEIGKKQIWDICLDKNEKLWVGCENEIFILNNRDIEKTINILPFSSESGSKIYVKKLLSDRDGTVWVGTSSGDIYLVDSDTYKIKNSIYQDDEVNAFYEDSDGKMWIGTENGLYSFNHGKITQEDIINNHLEDKQIYSIIRDSQGKMWLGTFGKGIFVFDANGSLIDNIVKDTGFISNAINHLFMDSNGGVWVATRDGLAYFEDTSQIDKYEVYDEKQGLENVFVRSVQQDKEGNIWISTNAGISFWDGVKFSNYSHLDGTPIGDFTNGSTTLRNDGILYFSSLNGVTYFNPEELTKVQQEVVPVQFIECLALNKTIEDLGKEILILDQQSGKIILKHNKNSFRISFSCPDHSLNKQVEYAYMMENLDHTWYHTQRENQVTFRNISPGEYTFKVKSRLKNQEWDETNIASIDFLIKPPLWLTWYAKLVYVVLSIILIFLIMLFYKKKIDLQTSFELERKSNQNKQELNEERLSFYTNITHELRTPLTLIIGPLEDMVQDSGLPNVYTKKIGVIHSSAVKLLNLINQLLEFRKTETNNRKLYVTKENIANLIAETGLRYKELNRNENVSIVIDIEDKEITLFFDTDVILTILNNLLSNAIKYTAEGEIRLSLRSLSEDGVEYTEIAVSDTGYGIEADAIPYIFEQYYQVKGKHQSSGTGIGLATVKSLAKLHEGDLQVKSVVNEGTTFTLRLLTNNTYPHAHHSEETSHINLIEGGIEFQNDNDADKRLTILVVEDNKEILKYIVSTLETDYQILTALNGREGLRLAQEHIPSIIISDIMMPEIDGIELCTRIKGDIRTSHITVVLLTAKDSLHDQERGYESGADSYLTKPFSGRLLQSRIINLLESRRILAEQIKTFDKGAYHASVFTKEQLRISKIDEEFIDKLTETVEENIEMEDLDIAFIKEKMNMSYSTFYRKVKGLTGIAPNELIRKIKLKNSLHLLLSGSYQISEVAYMSGFNDVVYFRKCFKDEFGMAPSEYAKSVSDS